MDGGRGRSFGERIEMREEVIKRACELTTKANKYCTESKQYLYEEISSSPEGVFAFAGAWSVNDWFSQAPFGEVEIDLSLFPSLRGIGTQETALVNQAFLRRFEAILKMSSLSTEVEKAVKERRQIVFAGHSSGGPLAIFATLWLLEKYRRTDCNTSPRCVTFGSPLVGDHIFPHAIRRENWARYFIHFVTRYDIVPRIMLAPFSSIEPEIPQVLNYFDPKSTLYKHSSVSTSSDASSLFENVLTKVSSVASHAASNLTGCTNSLVGNFSSFLELSPYRPFGTYIFCIENRKMVVVKHSDAVLQLFFHFSLLSFEEGGAKAECQELKESLVYENTLQHCLEVQNVVYLDTASNEVMETTMALDDLGLSTRAWLCLLAAEESEKQKLRNEEKIDKESIKEKLFWLQEYRRDCELRKVGYYDAYKIKADEKDFHANVTGLQLGGIWNEIIDMLRNYELPDEFEGNQEWLDLGTKLRRLDEPLAIAGYYSRGLNDEAGPYMIKGRPNYFRFTQRWREHDEKLPVESISESCFWAEVEELTIISKKECYADLKERITSLERQILHWDEAKVLEKDVFLDKSTFTRWWNSLPYQHKLESCIRGLFGKDV